MDENEMMDFGFKSASPSIIKVIGVGAVSYTHLTLPTN